MHCHDCTVNYSRAMNKDCKSGTHSGQPDSRRIMNSLNNKVGACNRGGTYALVDRVVNKMQ